MGGRHHYLAQELARLGHRVFLIAAGWHHLLSDAKTSAPDVEQVDGYTFVRIHVPRYTSAHGLGRIRNWFLFRKGLWALRKSLVPPDAILYSSPGIVAYPGALHLARHFKARLAFEVRDIWPLTLVELGSKSSRHPLITYMQRIEDLAYRTCDVALSNLSHVEEHMLSRGLPEGKFTYVPNGVSISEVSSSDPLNETAKAALPKDKFIVGYTGTLGLANKLDVLLEAAEALRDHDGIAFVLVGEGRNKRALMDHVRKLKLENVTFIDALPKRQIQSMLANFDVCYLGSSRSPLYRFGLAANKLYDYMYAARPLLLSYSGVGDPATTYGAGKRVDAEDAGALADAILWVQSQSLAERKAMGSRAKAALLEKHEYGALAQRLEKVLFPKGAA